MEKQRLVIFDEKMIELEIRPGGVHRNPIDIWRNLTYPGHALLPFIEEYCLSLERNPKHQTQCRTPTAATGCYNLPPRDGSDSPAVCLPPMLSAEPFDETAPPAQIDWLPPELTLRLGVRPTANLRDH